jgi:HPt (histidine-containing phosphotransfer) domain-containing protein/PAS domain-containing protein
VQIETQKFTALQGDGSLVDASQANPMRKIILIVGIAIAVFLGVSTLSVQKSFRSSDELTSIKDLYFPVLQKIEANIVRLDKMEELFMRSVMIGETDPLDEAEGFYQQADQTLVDVGKLYPEHKADVERLRKEFKDYNDLASSTAKAFLSKADIDMPTQTKRMGQTLDHLRASTKAFRESSYRNFVSTLADSQSTVKVNLYMGMALGVMNLAFMGVLVFFIRNNLHMMSVIAEQNASLERRVAERTAQLRQKTNDIQAMLQNMPQGVMTVLPGGLIHPEYSAYMETIFGTHEIAGRNLMDLVFTDTNLGSNDLSQVDAAVASCIGEDEMNYEFNSHLLVTEFDKTMPDGSRKSLALSWSPIADDNGVVEKLMLCVRDVSELKRLASEAGAQKRELEIIGEILAVTQEKFQDFIDGSRTFVEENEALIRKAQGKDADTIGLLFRNMHTIKGNARTYGLQHMTNTVHETEQAYDELRKNPQSEWQADALLAQLAEVGALVDEYCKVNEQKLGRKGPGRRGNVEHFLLIKRDQVTHALELVRQANQADAQDVRATLAEVGRTLQLIGTDKMEHVLSGIVESLPSLARELGKEPPHVSIQDNGIMVTNQISGLLKNVFTHLLRNAMDHGLETSEARLAAGKPASGHIFLSMAVADGNLRVHLHDDGRGLAVAKIRAKAIENGVLDPSAHVSPEDVANLIFASGFSTADKVTEVSGRGVGMDAVRGFLRSEGGDVAIRFLTGDVEAEWRPFELVITLPEKHTVIAHALAA